jgi:hypothetical protein
MWLEQSQRGWGFGGSWASPLGAALAMRDLLLGKVLEMARVL